MQKEDIENNYLQYTEVYNELMDKYNVYLVENPGTLVAITEKYNDIRLFLGEKNCQCINISSCVGIGKVGEFCKDKGITTNYGILCAKTSP